MPSAIGVGSATLKRSSTCSAFATTGSSAPQAIAILEKLGQVGSERSVPTLARLVDDRRDGVADAAIAALGGIGGDDAVELLVSLVSDRRLRVRGPAVVALGKAATPRAVEVLGQVARDRRHPERNAAIWALYPSAKHMLPRMRVLLDFLTEWFRDARATGTNATQRSAAIPRQDNRAAARISVS